MLMRSLAKRIGTKVAVCRQPKAPLALNKMFSTVAANTIHITFVDQEGSRATVPARCGMTLLEAATQNDVDIEGPCNGGCPPMDVRRTDKWVESIFGEGPSCFFCHVQIAKKYDSILPEFQQESADGLEDVWGTEVTEASRLACEITLDKRHDGMVVLVPDMMPTDII